VAVEVCSFISLEVFAREVLLLSDFGEVVVPARVSLCPPVLPVAAVCQVVLGLLAVAVEVVVVVRAEVVHDLLN